MQTMLPLKLCNVFARTQKLYPKSAYYMSDTCILPLDFDVKVVPLCDGVISLFWKATSCLRLASSSILYNTVMASKRLFLAQKQGSCLLPFNGQRA